MNSLKRVCVCQYPLNMTYPLLLKVTVGKGGLFNGGGGGVIKMEINVFNELCFLTSSDLDS